MTKHAWEDFGDETGAALVAGREVVSTFAHFEAVKQAVADHPEASSKPPLVCIPASDLTEASDDTLLAFVVGYLAAPVAWVDQGPSAIDRAQVRAALDAASALDDALWGELDALDPAGKSDELARGETEVSAIPFGHLAGVSVAFGVRQHEGKTADDLAREVDEDDDGDPDDWEWRLAPTPPGLKRVFGKGSDQRQLPDHVLGLSLGYGGDWTHVPFDLDDDAHAKRVEALTPHGLHTGAGYWLISVYD